MAGVAGLLFVFLGCFLVIVVVFYSSVFIAFLSFYLALTLHYKNSIAKCFFFVSFHQLNRSWLSRPYLMHLQLGRSRPDLIVFLSRPLSYHVGTFLLCWVVADLFEFSYHRYGYPITMYTTSRYLTTGMDPANYSSLKHSCVEL